MIWDVWLMKAKSGKKQKESENIELSVYPFRAAGPSG